MAVPRPRDDTESRFFGGPLEVGSWSMYETNSIKLEAMRVDLADVISEIRDLEAPAVSTEYWALADAACRKVIK